MSCASGCDSKCSSVTLGESAQDRDTGMTLPLISAAICSERLTRPRPSARVARVARVARAERAAGAAGIFLR